jgi:hypothetical protein
MRAMSANVANTNKLTPMTVMSIVSVKPACVFEKPPSTEAVHTPTSAA